MIKIIGLGISSSGVCADAVDIVCSAGVCAGVLSSAGVCAGTVVMDERCLT